MTAHSASVTGCTERRELVHQHHLGQRRIGLDRVQRHRPRQRPHGRHVHHAEPAGLVRVVGRSRAGSPRRCRPPPCPRSSGRRSPARRPAWPAGAAWRGGCARRSSPCPQRRPRPAGPRTRSRARLEQPVRHHAVSRVKFAFPERLEGLSEERQKCKSASRLFFSLRRPREQRAHCGLNVKRAFDQRLDAIGDRHVDVALARQLGERDRAELALGEAARAGFGRARPASERQAKSEVALWRRGAGQNKITEPRKAHQRRSPRPKNLAKTAESAKPRAVGERGDRARAKPAAGGDAAGDRQHILCRPTDSTPRTSVE